MGGLNGGELHMVCVEIPQTSKTHYKRFCTKQAEQKDENERNASSNEFIKFILRRFYHDKMTVNNTSHITD